MFILFLKEFKQISQSQQNSRSDDYVVYEHLGKKEVIKDPTWIY